MQYSHTNASSILLEKNESVIGRTRIRGTCRIYDYNSASDNSELNC
jgi:hypothetical protein